MDITIGYFISEMRSEPMLMIAVLLTFGVIFVNGWTDAPNAIATCVVTRCMNDRAAIIMAAIFNFLGVFCMCLLNATVMATIKNMVNFEGNNELALKALAAALVAIVIWAIAAWYFGIPTSESHALIAGLSGAAIALQGGVRGINQGEWCKVLYGLVLSSVMGFVLGYMVCRCIKTMCYSWNRKTTNQFFSYAQIAGGAAMSFMHGAQDGQKFMGVLLLGLYLAKGKDMSGGVMLPVWLMLICSIVMGLGTAVGGRKIIKSVGMDMVSLEKYQGFSADLAASLCLLISTLFGIPVSTTHTKTTAVMGVGVVKSITAINYRVVKDMVVTWVLTFPGCGMIGYIMAKLFIRW